MLVWYASEMARPLRVDVKNGWYHVTARGIERKAVFKDDCDHEHFLELLRTKGYGLGKAANKKDDL